MSDQDQQRQQQQPIVVRHATDGDVMADGRRWLEWAMLSNGTTIHRLGDVITSPVDPTPYVDVRAGDVWVREPADEVGI